MTRHFAELIENNKEDVDVLCNWYKYERLIHKDAEKRDEMKNKLLRLHDEFVNRSGYDHDETWLLEELVKYYDKEYIPDDIEIPEFYYVNISKLLSKR